MINLQSILSLFDDKPTLLKWLKKVEAALVASVLTDVGVEQTGEDVTLTFNFEDGTNIVAPAFKFNKQITGANIENGHLILTFADGSEEDAGNLFNGHVEVLSLTTPEIAVSTIGERASGQGVEFFNDIKVSSLDSNAAEISTKKPVVEVMNGYSFVNYNLANVTKENVYAGAVKNGNKLTLALFLKLTRTASTSDYLVGAFFVPSAIRDKLVPAVANRLEVKKVFASSSSQSGVDLTSTIVKMQYAIGFELYGLNSLSLDTEYFVRIETTFLLSDSLIS